MADVSPELLGLLAQPSQYDINPTVLSNAKVAATQAAQRAGDAFARGDYAGAAQLLAQSGDTKGAIGLQDRTSLQTAAQAANTGNVQGAGAAAAQTGDLAQVTAARGAGSQAASQQFLGLQTAAQRLASIKPQPGEAPDSPGVLARRAAALQNDVASGVYNQFGLSPQTVLKAFASDPSDLGDQHLAFAGNPLSYSGIVKKDETVLAAGKPVAEGYHDPITLNSGPGTSQSLYAPTGGAPLAQTTPGPVMGTTNSQLLSTAPGDQGAPVGGQVGSAVGTVTTNPLTAATNVTNPNLGGAQTPSPASAAVGPPSGAGGHNGAGGGTLGDRSNNPGNIRPPPGGTWQGQVGTNAAGYAVFDNAQDGARALDKNLAAYARHGITTPQALVERWASTSPPNEKAAYAARIQAAVGPQFDLNNPATRAAIAPAIAASEGTHLPTGSPKGPTDAPMPGTVAPPGPGQTVSSGGGSAIRQGVVRINGQDIAGNIKPNGEFEAIPGANLSPEQIQSLNGASYKGTENYRNALAAWNSLKGVSNQLTGPGAYSVLDTFARLINPGAIARAGTIGAIEEQLGPLNKFKGLLQAYQGKGSLTPEVRNQFMDAAYSFLQSHYAEAQQANAENSKIARAYNKDPTLVTSNIGVLPNRYSLPNGQGTTANAAQVRQQAQQALARGAPRGQVIGRLRQLGIDPSGL